MQIVCACRLEPTCTCSAARLASRAMSLSVPQFNLDSEDYHGECVKLLILGATGATGQQIVMQGLERGHEPGSRSATEHCNSAAACIND